MEMKYIETKIGQIADADFQSMITELCLGANWDPVEFNERSLSFLLMAMIRENRALTQQHLPIRGILTTKVGRIPYDSPVYHTCRELATLCGAPLDAFERKNVLSLINAAIRFYKSRFLKKR